MVVWPRETSDRLSSPGTILCASAIDAITRNSVSLRPSCGSGILGIDTRTSPPPMPWGPGGGEEFYSIIKHQNNPLARMKKSGFCLSYQTGRADGCDRIISRIKAIEAISGLLTSPTKPWDHDKEIRDSYGKLAGSSGARIRSAIRTEARLNQMAAEAPDRIGGGEDTYSGQGAGDGDRVAEGSGDHGGAFRAAADILVEVCMRVMHAVGENPKQCGGRAD